MIVTWALIISNLIIFALGYLAGDWFNVYFGLNALFFEGAWWQPLSTMFTHGSLMHIAMNMAVLYQFGSLLERFLGAGRFGALYLLGGLATSALSLSYLLYDPRVNLVGASGAICVLLGFLAFFDRRNAKGLFIALLLMSFAPLLVGVKVAWYAHIFGFAIGWAAGFFKSKF